LKILALETSARSVSAAVTEEGVPLACAYQNTGMTHSRTLMPLVDGLLRNSGMTLAEMDAVAVAAGPGSFTGIRIGIAAAKGLAWAADKPCCGVSTLDAMARNVPLFEGLVIGAMDARRQQIYNAVFEQHAGVLRRLTPDRAIGLEELAAELKHEKKAEMPKIIVGDGAHLCYTFLLEQEISCQMAPPAALMQNAVGVGQAAAVPAREGRLVTAQQLLPVYLRMSQAEREKLARGEKTVIE